MNSRKFLQLILLGGILLTELCYSEALDPKPTARPSLRTLEKTRREDTEKDEKLRTASQSLFGYNNGYNNGFGGGVSNGFGGGVNNGFGGGVNNGFGTGVNNGVYPQGSYASSGLYNGLNYQNQNGLAGYPFGYNGQNGNGFGFQGQGFYPGGVQQGYPSQGFQGAGFNNLGVGGVSSRYPQSNNFGMPYNTQGAIGVGTYQGVGGYNPSGGLYTGGQITDRRANQYIGNGITVGSNKIDVGGDGRSPAGVSSAVRNGRTNQPGFVGPAGQRQGFGLNYADQQGYNILPGGVYNAGNNGFGHPGIGGIQGGIYRQNPNIYDQSLEYNRFGNNGANRFYQGTNPQGSFQQRIHRFVGPDTDRN